MHAHAQPVHRAPKITARACRECVHAHSSRYGFAHAHAGSDNANARPSTNERCRTCTQCAHAQPVHCAPKSSARVHREWNAGFKRMRASSRSGLCTRLGCVRTHSAHMHTCARAVFAPNLLCAHSVSCAHSVICACFVICARLVFCVKLTFCALVPGWNFAHALVVQAHTLRKCTRVLTQSLHTTFFVHIP